MCTPYNVESTLTFSEGVLHATITIRNPSGLRALTHAALHDRFDNF